MLYSRTMLWTVLFSLIVGLTSCAAPTPQEEIAAKNVIERLVGTENMDNISVKLVPKQGSCDSYHIVAKEGVLTIEGTSATAITYAAYKYLKNECKSIRTWSGEQMDIPEVLPDYTEKTTSPYQLRYFLNVCTFGYTTPYWDWARWSEEIDWMALRGVNMPLATVAAEAIAQRVWLKMGLTQEEIDAFFTGAAHLPWHRMGNLNNFDGSLPQDWHEGQIEMQHKIMEKMRSLGMHPVAPAFAGFVPKGFMDKHPEITFNFLEWGGFDKACNAYVIAPDSPYFEKIGKLFIEEWEAEFGKCDYYLSDSFNEMRLPVDKNDPTAKHNILTQYGEAIYKSIAAGNPDATWVTQGWTFGYQHDFWDKESLQAMLSKVPNDKMIIIDLGNDYPQWVWGTDLTWRVHEGFYGKQWIYSYVPNFGGKTLPTGDIQMYASASVDALNSPFGKNLVGFGSAPEGLENNEIIYEVLADMGWRTTPIDLDSWMQSYATSRYGGCSDAIEDALGILNNTAFAALRSYPRFTWQTVDVDKRRKSLYDMQDNLATAVQLLLSESDAYGNSELYRNDVVEYTALLLGYEADRYYHKALAYKEKNNMKAALSELDKVVTMLHKADSIISVHPRYQLGEWVDYARGWGNSPAQQTKYESNAKRLITTWGGWQEDYAARFWSGMISDYYIPRIEIYFSDSANRLDEWEETWITTDWKAPSIEIADPIALAKEYVEFVNNTRHEK